jgi:hypothetical protein
MKFHARYNLFRIANPLRMEITMALTPGSFYQSGVTGSTETLTLVPPANGATQAQIVAASYGNDTTDVTIAPGGMSVAIKVQKGFDSLVVTVVSPNVNDKAKLVQGNNTFASFDVTNHWDSEMIYIQGI